MNQKEIKGKSSLIDVNISDDGMQAFIAIKPIGGKEVKLTVEEIKHALWENGVKFGINEEAIIAAIETERSKEPVLVAEGMLMVNGEDAVIEYKFERDPKPKFIEDIDGRVDYRECKLIQTVRAGNVMAVKRPATPGTIGRKCNNNEIFPLPGRDLNFTGGENTQISPDGLTLISKVDGYITWKEGKICVIEVYVVSGDVTMAVGNIYFVGPIKIQGNVNEGFVIEAEGDIEIGGNVSNATVRGDSNIVITGGIVGKKAYIQAKGNLKCKFIENATVNIGGNLGVHDAILHSSVDAGGGIVVLGGRKGAIIGGKVRATHEINVKNIGSILEVPTKVEVGIDPTMRQEMEELEKALLVDQRELLQLRLRYNTLLAREEKEAAEECLIKQRELDGSIKMMTERVNQIREEISAKFGGKISIFEHVWPAVRITIRTASLLLKTDYNYVTFVERFNTIERKEYERPKIQV